MGSIIELQSYHDALIIPENPKSDFGFLKLPGASQSLHPLKPKKTSFTVEKIILPALEANKFIPQVALGIHGFATLYIQDQRKFTGL
jgi:hypothetical protein